MEIESQDLGQTEPSEPGTRPEQLPAEDEHNADPVENQGRLPDEIGAALAYYQLSSALANKPEQSRVWRRLSRTARKNRKARWVAITLVILFGGALVLDRRTEFQVSAKDGAFVQTVTPVANNPSNLLPSGQMAIAPTPLAALPSATESPLPEPTTRPTALRPPTRTSDPPLAPQVTLLPTALPEPKDAQVPAPSSSGAAAASSSVSSPAPAPARSQVTALGPAPTSDNAASSDLGSIHEKGSGDGGRSGENHLNGDSHGGGISSPEDGGNSHAPSGNGSQGKGDNHGAGKPGGGNNKGK